MLKERIVETNHGIQGELTVQVFDEFARNMRDKGWNNINSIRDAGILKGKVLEIGPGPGYLGLEWLKNAPDSHLTGCEISRDMIAIAEKNARTYRLDSCVQYVEGNAMQMPFADSSFDGVFSNGSLHEWQNPVAVFNEIDRVLKPGGLYCITDMRRDVNPLIKWSIYFLTRPKEIRPGFLSSQNASYTSVELKTLLNASRLANYSVQNEFFGLCIIGSRGL